MTEYEEICIGKSITQLNIELEYQYSLGYKSTDSFPQYIMDLIKSLENSKIKTMTKNEELIKIKQLLKDKDKEYIIRALGNWFSAFMLQEFREFLEEEEL